LGGYPIYAPGHSLFMVYTEAYTMVCPEVTDIMEALDEIIEAMEINIKEALAIKKRVSELKGRNLRNQGENLLNALGASLKINEALSMQYIKTMVVTKKLLKKYQISVSSALCPGCGKDTLVKMDDEEEYHCYDCNYHSDGSKIRNAVMPMDGA